MIVIYNLQEQEGLFFNGHFNLIKLHVSNKCWSTYRRKRVGMYADNIVVDFELAFTLRLIHELTHYVQFLQGRILSEVETTRNEIEYVKTFHEMYYKKLTLM